MHTPHAPQPLTDTSQAWEFVPGFEPPEAYEAFAWYRDLGPTERSLARVARDLGASYGSVVRWAQLYLWRDRVLTYDAHRAQEREAKRREAEGRVDAKWAESRAELLRDYYEAVGLAVAQLRRDLANRRGVMRPNEVTRALDVLIKWQNLANGDLTEKVDVGFDLANMSDEQLTALEVLRKVRTAEGGDNEE